MVFEVCILGLDVNSLYECFYGFLAWMNLTYHSVGFVFCYGLSSMYTGTWCKFTLRMCYEFLEWLKLAYHSVGFVFCYGLWSMYTGTSCKFTLRMFYGFLAWMNFDLS